MAKNKTNLDEKTLAELKQALIEKRERIKADLASFSKKSKDIKGDFDTEFQQIGDRPDENALEVTAYEDNLGVEHQLEKDLAAVEEALKRMENGSYGLCYNCGTPPQPIDIKRLKAFPEAKTCLKCSTLR